MTIPVQRTSFWIVCFSLLVFKTAAVWAQANDATDGSLLQIGFGQVEITPVRPTPMAGPVCRHISLLRNAEKLLPNYFKNRSSFMSWQAITLVGIGFSTGCSR